MEATLRRGFLLAGWANPEELQSMCHCLEFALRRDALLQLSHHAITYFHNAGALRANQMMLMPMVTLVNQSKPRRSVPKMESLYELEPLEQLH